VSAPTEEALQALLHKIIARLMKLLTRRGVLVEEEGSSYLANGDAESDELPSARGPDRRRSRCKAPCPDAPPSPKRASGQPGADEPALRECGYRMVFNSESGNKAARLGAPLAC